MYDLAPRFTKFKNTNPSPNTYVLCSTSTCHKEENVVPFLSISNRFQKIQPTTDALYLPSTNQHIKGGSSLRNRAKRSEAVETNPKNDEIQRPTLICFKEQKKGKLVKSSVADLNIKSTAPSVIDLGPAHYNVQFNSCCERYKGCKWSCRTGTRKTYEIRDGPGPAHYTIEKDPCSCFDQSQEEYREMARRLTFLPRFCEAQILKTVHENLPGPGYYCIDKNNACKSACAVEKRPFITSASRLAAFKAEGPSPTTYDATNVWKKRILKSFVPFGVQSERAFQTNCTETPGPASYNIKDLLQETIDKKAKYALWYVPFNNTAKRFQNTNDVTPSPLDYKNTLVNLKKCDNKRKSSVFKSKVARFKDKCQQFDPVYDVVEAFRRNVDQVSHNANKSNGFNVKAKRQTIFDGINKNLPGPAEYSISCDGYWKGFTFLNSPRFNDAVTGTPGPADYKIKPHTGKAFTTHNLRLKQNVSKRKI